MNWIQKLVDACKENESPERFFYWSAISSISAVLRKNVYLERHYYKLYPNVYVFLVAKSGSKKGIPISVTKRLIRKVNCTRIISGRSSMAAIIRDLGKAFTLENGGFVKEAHATILSGELAAFMVKDLDAITILTDLYNTHENEPEWINSLKVSGVDKLREPCITLFGATNEELFPDAVPANAIGGGFIARTFIVFSPEKGTPNSLTEKPKTMVNIDELSKYLLELSTVKGEFEWSSEAKNYYDDWYYAFAKENHRDPTGTYNRIGDQILKVAMIIALAERPLLVLEKRHVEEAHTVSMECIIGMRQVTMGQGKSSLAFQTRIVLKELIARPDHQITKERLLQIMWGDMDAFDLEKVIQTLIASGAVDEYPCGKTVNYRLSKQALEMYTTHKRSIM
jgi:hypothetical protein